MNEDGENETNSKYTTTENVKAKYIYTLRVETLKRKVP